MWHWGSGGVFEAAIGIDDEMVFLVFERGGIFGVSILGDEGGMLAVLTDLSVACYKRSSRTAIIRSKTRPSYVSQDLKPVVSIADQDIVSV